MKAKRAIVITLLGLIVSLGAIQKWIDKSEGWEIVVGPSIVVVDAGAAASMTSTTAQSDIYAFFFDQKGLMAGLGLQGTKITRLEK
jgi:lipid-binding SYLF domain-containing protein